MLLVHVAETVVLSAGLGLSAEWSGASAGAALGVTTVPYRLLPQRIPNLTRVVVIVLDELSHAWLL